MKHDVLLGLQLPVLCLITDEGMATREVEARVADACAAGCRFVQLRNRRLEKSALRIHVQHLRRVTADHGAVLVINSHADLAVEVGADAVHLPADFAGADSVREIAGGDIGIGRSVHSADEIDRFARERPDYFQFGPVYETPSKARYGPPQGIARLRDFAQRVSMLEGPPALLAVGGIRPENVVETIENGADGVAVIGAVMNAPEAGEATAELLAAVLSANRTR